VNVPLLLVPVCNDLSTEALEEGVKRASLGRFHLSLTTIVRDRVQRVLDVALGLSQLCEFQPSPPGATTMTDRATRGEISQALAKAIAYRDCGKPEAAADWAARLVRMLEAQKILKAEYGA
jgi:hypothetical protein